MNGILQGFVKTYMLAYFLPSGLFISANVYVFMPAIAKYKLGLDANTIAFYQNQYFLIIILSAFTGFAFMSSSSHLVKWFEGYLFQRVLFFIFQPLKKIQKLKHDSYIKRIRLINEETEKSQSRRQRKFFQLEIDNVTSDMLMKFSGDYRDILPTSFGNIFKSFENYPKQRYGMDAVVLWPRLVKVIPTDYGDRLEDTNNSIVFLLVSCFLFAIMGIECLFILVFRIGQPNLLLLLKVLLPLCFILSFSFYRISLRTAANYGEVVKSCFDLFRYDLIKAFGIKRRLSLAQERVFWRNLCKFILTGDGDPFK